MIVKGAFIHFLPTSFHAGERSRDDLCHGGSLPLEAATPHTLLDLFLRSRIPHVALFLFLVADGASRGYPQLTSGEIPH
jgi:hypothetical protein